MKMNTSIIKCENRLLKELSVLSHARIMRFDITFLIEKPTSLLLQTVRSSIVYKNDFSGGSWIWLMCLGCEVYPEDSN